MELVAAKPFVENYSQKLVVHPKSNPITYLWCHHRPRDAAAAASRRCFSSLSLSLLHRNNILPVSSSAAPALSASETQPQPQPQALAAGDEGIQTKDTTEFKTVHIKVALRRECSFGQQFLMVGDDPMFGLWDPVNAIPLNWSEGHVWAVEMDVPCDKVMKYKFILKGSDDYILWQPGPDRILQTWETKKTIIVSEDWDNAELQTIMEEDPVTDQLSQSVADPQVLKETENLLQLNGEPDSYLENAELQKAEKPIAAVAENITGQNGEKELEAAGFPVSELSPSADKVATLGTVDYPNAGRSSGIEINLDSGGAAVPVLIPGLTPVPAAKTEEASVSKAEKHIRTDSSLNIPEPHMKEETKRWLSDKLGLQEKGQEQPKNIEEGVRVLEKDFHWVRRNLQQFLVYFGLMNQNL